MTSKVRQQGERVYPQGNRRESLERSYRYFAQIRHHSSSSQ